MFSIQIDSTQDFIAVDQLAIVVRSVHEGLVVERFLVLAQLTDGSGQGLFHLESKILKDNDIPLTASISNSTIMMLLTAKEKTTVSQLSLPRPQQSS